MKYIWLYIVAIVASLGGLLSGYDTGVISGALLFINETWVLPDTLQGFLVSCFDRCGNRGCNKWYSCRYFWT